MKTLLFMLFSCCIISPPMAFAADPSAGAACTAEMFDTHNMPIAKLEWKQDFFIGIIAGDGLGVRISTSLGSNQMMSLWIREKRQSNPNGSFSFLDLSSGRAQHNALYLANGYHIGVTCRLENR